MKYIIFLTFFCVFSIFSNAQPKTIYTLKECKKIYVIDSLLNTKNYTECIREIKGVAASNSIIREDRLLYYKLFFCYKKIEQLDSAQKYIFKSLKMGMYCLANCSDYSAFLVANKVANKKIIKLLKQNRKRKNTHKQLLKELKSRVDLDQSVRLGKRYRDSMEKEGLIDVYTTNMHKVDSTNTERVKEIIHKYGWLGYSELGIDGDKYLWLLIQHIDKNNFAFQKYVLSILGTQVLLNNTSKKNYAFLYDRVCVKMEKPQVFGTQFKYINSNGDNDLIPFTISDEKNIDYYRVPFGLIEYAIHLKLIGSNH